MKKSKTAAALIGACLAAMAATANATPTNTQTEFLVNGMNAAATGIDASTGLGTRTFTFSTAGSYDVRAFFDLDLSLLTTGFSNEYGSAFNIASLRQGQSWEIDEPGYWKGDVHNNFKNGDLQNTVGTEGVTTIDSPDDVAVALGWKFNLGQGYKATISFTASETFNSSLFYLGQFDNSDPANGPVYFYSDLRMEPTGGNPVPEPSTFALLSTALLGAAMYRRRSRNK